MSRTRRPPSVERAGRAFARYVTDRLAARRLSVRAAALAIGISYSYLTEIAAGRRVPDAGIAQEIARFFGDAPEAGLRLAGWLEGDAPHAPATVAPAEEKRVQQLRQLAGSDPRLMDVLERYQQLPAAGRRQLLKIIEAYLAESK